MKVAVLVSGGVDSSVALKLLQEDGYDVTAFYLKIWLEDELAYLGSCPWQEDLGYVEKVCEQLRVPLEIISLQKEYQEQIVGYTIGEIKAGRTPNPDILCNKRIKFGMFYSKLDELYPDMNFIATGHYARKRNIKGQSYLISAVDKVKDQTYFLSGLTQAQIKRAFFPIGHLQKQEVRLLAEKFNLPNKSRKDSQGICFLGKLKFSDFIRHHLGDKAGNIIEFETGKKLGQHLGYWYYTIGQRQGLNLAGGPWYVVKKDIENNIVFISKSYYADDKIRNSFFVSECNWINESLSKSANLSVKIRHGVKLYNCSISLLKNNINNNIKYKVNIEGNDQGIAAGQYAVFYDKDICLGSGVIDVS